MTYGAAGVGSRLASRTAERGIFWLAVLIQATRTGRSERSSKARTSSTEGSGGSIARIARLASHSPIPANATPATTRANRAKVIRRSMVRAV